MSNIPIFRPFVGDEELQSLKTTLDSGWLGLGPRTQQFEEELAKYVGAKFGCGTNSCTSGLHIALRALGIGSGDDVLVPSLTFVATAHAIVYAGAKPRWVDVHPDTLCLDTQDLPKRMTKRCKAIIPVHYGGHPCDMDEIHEFAKENDLAVIEDAAQAIGAEYNSKKIGGLSDATVFSFHATKNITTGEGGMVTTNSKRFIQRLKQLRFLGANQDTWSRISTGKPHFWHFVCEELGYKYYMNDIAAAIGLAQLPKLPSINARKREITAIYNDAFSGMMDKLELPVERSYVKSCNYNYVIKVKASVRDKLILHLQQKGVSSGVHYMPVHLHPYYRRFKAKLPVTDQVWRRILTLPLYAGLTDEEAMTVIQAVKGFF